MFYKPKKLEDYILLTLQKSQLNTKRLINELKKIKPKTTKQAVYQILRKLKKEEVVVVHNKQVSLSNIWINKMTDYFAIAQYNYTQVGKESNDFLKISDGDKIAYTFNNPEKTDQFWVHAMAILTSILGKKEGIYIYNPHEWFLLARPDSEKSIFDLIKKYNRQLFLTIGSNDFLDKEVVKNFQSDSMQCYIAEKNIFPKRNYYFNIFGDYIIEVWIDKDVATDIDSFYKNTKVYDSIAKSQLEGIISKRGKNKLVISKNSRRSEKIKKTLSKNFYIKS